MVAIYEAVCNIASSLFIILQVLQAWSFRGKRRDSMSARMVATATWER